MRLELHDGYVVRDWRASDAEALPRHANDRRIWLGLRDAFPHPYTPEDAHRFLAMVAAQDPRTYFCIASPHDEAIGAIGFLRHQDVERFSAEIGYWLSRRHWGPLEYRWPFLDERQLRFACIFGCRQRNCDVLLVAIGVAQA